MLWKKMQSSHKMLIIQLKYLVETYNNNNITKICYIHKTIINRQITINILIEITQSLECNNCLQTHTQNKQGTNEPYNMHIKRYHLPASLLYLSNKTNNKKYRIFNFMKNCNNKTAIINE